MFVRVSLAALRIVLLMGVVTIDDLGGNMMVDEGRYQANDNDTCHEEADENERRSSGRETGSGQVLFGGGEHAIQRGEELDGRSAGWS